MAEQIQKQKQHQEQASTVEETVETPNVDSSETLEDIDGLLDEIDAVLEENAEEFVGSFVQKGGE